MHDYKVHRKPNPDTLDETLPEKPHLLFLDGCYGNYTIRDGYFYSWHATDQPNFVVMPYIDGIDYRGRISIENDTLKLSVRFGFAPENVGIGWYVRK
ncbi:MAG: hypothetical protein II894_01810 [Bacteroidales bacterium]|nr:hypothetical protein [Bacteroidales bacterium]